MWVAMQNGAAAVKNSVEVPQNPPNRASYHMIQSFHCEYTIGRMESRVSKRYFASVWIARAPRIQMVSAPKGP